MSKNIYLDFGYTPPNIEILGNTKGLELLKEAIDNALSLENSLEPIKSGNIIKFRVKVISETLAEKVLKKIRAHEAKNESHNKS